MQFTVGGIAVALVAGLVFLTLAAQSGALVWAIVGGLGTSAVTFFIARDLRIAAVVGGMVTLAVSVLGIANMLAG